MSLRTSSDSDSMPIDSIQQPDCRQLAARTSRLDQVVGAGVAEPLHVELARDQLVAEARERLLVERDRVAPEVEVRHAQRALGLLDLVDDRLGVALAELVALVDAARRRSRTCTGSRGSSRPARRARLRAAACSARAAAGPTPETAWSGSRRTSLAPCAGRSSPPRRYVRLGMSSSASRFSRVARATTAVLGLADDHAVDVGRAQHRFARHRGRVRAEAEQRRAEARASACAHLEDVGVERRRRARKDDERGPEAVAFEPRDDLVGGQVRGRLVDQAELHAGAAAAARR